MIKCNDLVPKVYSDSSSDFRIFTALLDLVFNSVDVGVESIRNLHSPEKCFSENLGRLAKCLNLESSSRELLGEYRLLSKSKGTEDTIKRVVELCGGSGADIEFEDGVVNLTMPAENNFNSLLFYTLARRVFPFYCRIDISF